jgi:hypothetical protein
MRSLTVPGWPSGIMPIKTRWLILEGDLLSVAERGDIQRQGAPVLTM